MQVAVNKQHVLFGAAHQLDARLSGMHQGAIRRKIVKRHAARGETCLELLSDRAAIQHGDRILGQSAKATSPTTRVFRGRVPGGHAYTRTILTDASGRAKRFADRDGACEPDGAHGLDQNGGDV